MTGNPQPSGRSPNAAVTDRLQDIVKALQEMLAWAAEMQLGAEGFDNTTAARTYAGVQARLQAAAHEIEQAAAALDRYDRL